MLGRKSLSVSHISIALTNRNYTIEVSYVTPHDSVHPRSNLVARDRSMSNGPGSEDFPYSGQSFVRFPRLIYEVLLTDRTHVHTPTAQSQQT